MITAIENIIISFVRNVTLGKIICIIILLALAAGGAIVVQLILTATMRILSKKGKYAAVRSSAKFAAQRHMAGKIAFLVFFLLASSLTPYMYSFAKTVATISFYAQIVCLTIICTSLIDVFGDAYAVRPIARKRSIKGPLQVVKMFIYTVFATIAISLLINQNPLVLISGLSAFAAILAIVFKDALLGLVAGIQITSEDLLHIGDWVSIPSMNVEGSITDISLISVRITKFDNTVSVVPSYTFLSVPFTNYRKAVSDKSRQFSATINIDVTSLKGGSDGESLNLKEYRESVREMIKSSGHIREDHSLLVHPTGSDGRGIPLKIMFTTDIGDYDEFVSFSGDMLEKIIARLPEYDLSLFQERHSDKV